MTQPPHSPIRIRLSTGSWISIIAGLFVVGLILVAIAVLALGIFLFVLPFVAVMTVLYYLFPSMFGRRRPQRQRASVTIIDGDFRVVDPYEPDRQRIEQGP